MLFSAETPLSLTAYVSVIRLLAERGHQVIVTVHVEREAGWRDSLLTEVVDQTSVEERTDYGLIKEKLRVELRRFLRKRSGRRPFVLPVIMEI